MKNLILHLHPKTISVSSLSFKRTFGLGGIAIVLFIIQILSGILLRFYYEPIPGQAYYSILYIHNDVFFGAFIRNIHHWSGVILVLVVFIHMVRTFLSGAFFSPRKMNWFMGLILFFLVLLANFSGYLLPWDQLSYWAVTISTGILTYLPLFGDFLRQIVVKGDEINSNTLSFFYTWHTAIIPVLIFVIMLFHFWLVRKAGGVLDPQSNSEKVAVNPHLIYREWIVMLAITAVVLMLAAFFNAPLQDIANPAFSPNPIKAPWYFAGIQELLLHFHPQVGGILIPLAFIAFLVLLPLIPVDPKPDGTWFFSAKGRRAALPAMIISIILTLILVIADHILPSFSETLGLTASFLADGLLPLIVVSGIGWAYLSLIIRRYDLNRSEYLLVIGIILITVFITLTIIGHFLRGVDMELIFFTGQG